MLQISIILLRTFSWLMTQFSTICRSDYKLGDFKFRNQHPQFAHFLTADTINSISFYRWRRKGRHLSFSEQFAGLRNCFIKARTNIDANPVFRNVSHCSALQPSPTALTLTHLSVSFTKRALLLQRHSPHQVAPRCLASGQPCNWWPGGSQSFGPQLGCVLCGYENKQRLFPYTALTDWFV